MAPAVLSVSRQNTKQTAQQQQVQQQQHADQWAAAYHPSLLSRHHPSTSSHPPSSQPTLTLQPSHLGAIRSPYLTSGRSLRSDNSSPMTSASYPSSPLTSASFSLQASPAIFSSSAPDGSTTRRLLHPASLLPGDAQIQQLLSPSSGVGLVQLPTLPYSSLSLPLMTAPTQMETLQTFYPTALSSFYTLPHPSTPILTARPPPVLPRFPGSPDVLYSHVGMMASSPLAYAQPSPSTHGAFSPHFFAGALATTGFTPQQQAALQASQQTLVESSLKFGLDRMQPNTPVVTARALTAIGSGPAGGGEGGGTQTSPDGSVRQLGRRRSTRGSREEKGEDGGAADSRSSASSPSDEANGGSGSGGGRSRKRSLGPSSEEGRGGGDEEKGSRRRRRGAGAAPSPPLGGFAPSAVVDMSAASMAQGMGGRRCTGCTGRRMGYRPMCWHASACCTQRRRRRCRAE